MEVIRNMLAFHRTVFPEKVSVCALAYHRTVARKPSACALGSSVAVFGSERTRAVRVA